MKVVARQTGRVCVLFPCPFCRCRFHSLKSLLRILLGEEEKQVPRLCSLLTELSEVVLVQSVEVTIHNGSMMIDVSHFWQRKVVAVISVRG